MNFLNYRGYIARVEVDVEARLLHGKVLYIKDVVTFESDTVKNAEKEFHRSINFYIKGCERLGRMLNQPSVDELFRQNKHLPPTVKRFMQQPNSAAILIAAIEPWLANKEPNTIIRLTNDLENLLINLDTLRFYLKSDEPDAIVEVVKQLDSLLKHDRSKQTAHPSAEESVEEVSPNKISHG